MLTSEFGLRLQFMPQVPAPPLTPPGRHWFIVLARQDDRQKQADALRRQHLAPLGEKLLEGFPTGRMLRSRSYSPRGLTLPRRSRRATSQSIWSVSEYQVKPTIGHPVVAHAQDVGPLLPQPVDGLVTLGALVEVGLGVHHRQAGSGRNTGA